MKQIVVYTLANVIGTVQDHLKNQNINISYSLDSLIPVRSYARHWG
jgi:hypothetical protein